MIKGLPILFKRNILNISITPKKQLNNSILNYFLTSNTFKSNYYTYSTLNKSIYLFSSKSPHTINSHKKHNHSHNHGDPIENLRKELQVFSKQIQQKYPNSHEQVIRQLYSKCQALVGQNKRVQILILFEIICEFIESKNLVQTYSSFMIMSANNSFLMGKYQQVERRCKLALQHEIKKHGEKHKNIGDIYNMLGISISKSAPGKGEEALNYLQKAFAIRKQLFGQSGQTAEILFNAGIIEEQSQKMLQKAEKNYLDAVQMLENCGFSAPLLYVKTKMRLSQVQHKIHQSISKYISDLLRIEQAVQKFKNQKKFGQQEHAAVDMFLSLLHRNLGRKFLQTNQAAKSIKYFDQCLSYLRQNKMQTQDRIQVLQSCAIAHVNLQEYEKASKLLQEADKVLMNYPTSQEYKFQFWKYLSQVYRKTKQLEKQYSILQKMIKLLQNTKQKFVHPTDILDSQLCLIYCLGNLKKFDKVIQKGSEILKQIQVINHPSPLKQNILNYKANILAYVGFAYLSTSSMDKALQYFEMSDRIFSQLYSDHNRNDFHLNVLKKISMIYIQIKKDFKKGFFHLNKQKELILQNKNSNLSKRLNELVILLLDYEVQQSQNSQQLINQLIQAKYIENVNSVLEQIVKQVKQISNLAEPKQLLGNYYVLVFSIYQMLISFNGIKSYNGKYEAALKTKQLLNELIGVYDKVYAVQIQEINSNLYKGDQMLSELIKKSLQVKIDLKTLQLTN